MKKKLLYSFFVLVLLFTLFLYIMIFHILPYGLIRPVKLTRAELTEDFAGKLTPRDHELRARNLDLAVRNGKRLKGWYIYTDSLPARGTIIIMHGINSNKESMIARAGKFAEAGYNSVVFDAWAHGASTGKYFTYGYYEKHDFGMMLDTLEKLFPDSGNFGIYAASVGSAVALQAMPLEPRITCAFLECPFADLREICQDLARGMFFIKAPAIIDMALDEAGRLAKFDIDEVRPEIAARQVIQPVTITHGTEDMKIRISHGRRVFANLASRYKKFIPVEGAGHINISSTGGKEYMEEITGFFDAYLRKR